MKSKLMALAFLVAMTSTASATVNWQGEIMVTTVSAGCAASGDLVGDNYLANYFPQGLSNNGTISWLSFFNRRSGWVMRFTSTAAGAIYNGTRLTSRGPVTLANGQILSFTRTPAVITATTQTIAITAQISNWLGGNTGCTVTIQGAFTRRV